MKKSKSLKQRASEISIGAFIAITVVMFTSFTMYSIKKTTLTEEKIRNELTLNLRNQTNLFLPSFLLPEQQQGMNLLLERIKRDENLKNISIIKNEADLPLIFSQCKIDPVRVVTCASKDMSETAIVAPLTELNVRYGYILKSKMNTTAKSLIEIMQFAGLMLLMLGLTFVVMYAYISKMTATKVPIALDNLVKWMESEIHGKKSDEIELHFEELEALRGKISEVFARYNRSRDQAIIGQVTSGIMHDIKTPLQSIVTALHLANEKEINTPKRLSRLENLFNMCRDNLPLIGDIIETTLDGNRNIRISKSSFNLRETIDSSVIHHLNLSRNRKVTVKVDAPEELIASYDPLQLVRVMNNLLKNGIEAASESGKSPSIVKVSIGQNENRVIVLSVEDSGNGFKGPPDRVFRAFGTTKARGTGLGLLITKKIIEAHQGNITASNSSVYGGAKMEVTLPLEV